MEKPNKSYSNAPSICDICESDFAGIMYDALTVHGRWGNLCRRCFRTHGIGLGTGKGQRYTQSRYTDEWVKTDG